MTDNKISVALPPGYSLPFPDLRQDVRQMQPGGVYWIAIPKASLASRLVGQTLAMAAPNTRAALFADHNLPEVLSFLKDPQSGPENLHNFTIKKPLSRFLMQFTHQADRALRPRKRLLIVLIDMNADDAMFVVEKRQELLRTWRNWVELNDCALLIVTHGFHAEAIAATLNSENAFLSGLSLLQMPVDVMNPPVTNYQLMFWRSALGVIAQKTIHLRIDQHYFTEVESARHSHEQIDVLQRTPDVVEVFFQRSVLEGAPISMAANWQEVGTWQDLLHKGLEVPYATLVFAMTADQDIAELARILYELRLQRADALRLVVREMGHVLRNQELDLLKDCGVSRVIADVNLARFFTILEESQEAHLPYRLTDDIELTLAAFSPQPVRGIVGRDTFCEYMDGIVQNLAQNRSLGVLVLLRPVPMITPQMLASQIRLTRMGDVGCVVDNGMYLFLFGCQLDYVTMVLQRVFELPISELIVEQQVFTEYDSVEEIVMHLRDMPISIEIMSESIAESESAKSHTSEKKSLFSPTLVMSAKH